MSEGQLAIPTTAQVKWHDMEMGMFIHWSPCVYQESQGDNLTTDLSEINPYLLDTDQWVDVACDLGAKYIVLVAKHVGGFCLWQTDTTEYGVKNIPWRDGKGDVMADISASCKKRGIKLGVYISPCDKYLGAKVGGQCKTPEKQKAYDKVYRQQVTELLTRYGDIVEVWFDGSTGIEVGDLLEQYVPEAMIFQSPYATIRWVGNEKGIATYPAWNSLSVDDAKSGVATNRHGNPDGKAWIPLECDTTIRGSDWFWSTTNEKDIRSLDELMNLYYHSVGNGAVLLLNSNPDRTGVIPEADAKRAKEFGDEIRRRFEKVIAQTSGVGKTLELDLGGQKTIDHIVLMEDISLGERVRMFAVEGYINGKWIRLSSGTAIGHKNILKINEVELSKVRLNILASVDEPHIRSLQVYYSNVSDNTVSITSDTEDIVVGEWGEELLWQNDGDVELSLNLTSVIPYAGQFEVSLVSSGGEVALTSAKLFFGDAECADYVTIDKETNKINLFMPGVGQDILLNVKISGKGDFKGRVMLKQV